MHAQPQKEHEWLQQLVGEWTIESECSAGPGEPPQKYVGTDSVRSLGGLWVLCEGKAEMPGGGIGHSLMSLGFDPLKKRFTGTFIASMMTHLWIYDGELVAAGNVLTLSAEGPVFGEEGKMAMYHDIIEIINPDHRTLKSEMLGDDGAWVTFMTAHYRRKK